RSLAPRRRLVFDRGPALLPPDANGALVALGGALDGTLHAVAQAMQQTTDVRGIRGDPKGAADHLADSFARPGLPAKPRRLRSTVQERGQLSQLLRREFGRGAGGWMPTQPFLYPLRSSPCQPLAHRASRHSQGGSDVLLFPARLFELP